MTLILTGMAVFYSYTAWAPVVMKAFGGPQVTGIIHRISAAIMLGIFFLHLIGVAVNIYRNRKTFRWFGSDSLVPNWKDLKDAVGMFKWFVGKGPRPIFDRWTYWEKFDYWAVFWGMAMIGGTGMLLAFPHVTASIFSGMGVQRGHAGARRGSLPGRRVPVHGALLQQPLPAGQVAAPGCRDVYRHPVARRVQARTCAAVPASGRQPDNWRSTWWTRRHGP